MVITPFFAGDWHYVQTVWERWQALNVGIVALVGSLIALNISAYLANNQREREFRAARAHLPSALGQLNNYTKLSAVYYKKAWRSLNEKTTFNESPPDEPENYQQVFTECIRHAPPNVGDWLAKIIKDLQTHSVLMTKLRSDFENPSLPVLTRYNLIGYTYELGRLQALINRLSSFAKGEDNFVGGSITQKDFELAHSVIGINIDSFSAKIPDSDKVLSLRGLIEGR